MNRWTALLVGVVVLASLVAGCAPPEPEVVEVTRVVTEKEEVEVPVEVEVEVTRVVEPTPMPEPKTLRIVKMEPNVGLDPATASTSLSIEVLWLMHDPLVEYDEDWQPIPWVAESWDTNEDQSEWTFNIKEGLAFSDGSPITAEDVKFSFEYAAARPAFSGVLACIESIEVPDELTVVLKMNRPVPEFLFLPAGQVAYPILSKAACEGGGCGDFTVPGVVTSGPWKLAEYVLRDHMTLVKNEYYGFEGLPKFDRVLLTWTGDRTAAVAAVEAGEADYTTPVNAPDAARLMDAPNVSFYQATTTSMRGWAFDKTKPPFSDKRVRQAIGYAVEPEEITQSCWYGFANSLYGGVIFEQDAEWGDVLSRSPWKGIAREERLDMANELLTEAGWEDRDGDGIRESYGIAGIDDGTPLTAEAVYEKPWVQAECQALLTQDYLKDIGFDLTLQGLPKTNYWPDAVAGKFGMWHIGLPSSPLPWEGFRDLFHPDGRFFQHGARVFGAEGDKLKADIDAIAAEQDFETKKQMMSELADYLAEEQFMVCTGSQNRLVATNGQLEGYYAIWTGSPRPLTWADIPE